MASIPNPIERWIEQFTSARGFFQSSSEVDHDATSNRTHDGDDLSPATLEVTDTINTADLSAASEAQVLQKAASGTDLQFGTVDSPAVNWIQSGATPISVQLAFGESTTVPAGEDWMVSAVWQAVPNGTTPSISGEPLNDASSVVQRTVLEGGTSITANDSQILLQGFDVSGLSLETVTAAFPDVPSGETWVGGLIFSGENIDINGVAVGSQDSSTYDGFRTADMWTVLKENDSSNGIFGGFKI